MELFLVSTRVSLRLSVLRSLWTYELRLTHKHKLFKILLRFQIYWAWTLHLMPRWPCAIISSESLSIFFALFSFWLLLDKISVFNRCAIWAFSSEPRAGAFHRDGWGRDETRECVSCAENQSIDFWLEWEESCWTLGLQGGSHWFAQPKTNARHYYKEEKQGECQGPPLN